MAECRQEKKGHSMLLSGNAAPAAAKQHIVRKGHFHSQREKGHRIHAALCRVSKIFGGINFRGQFRGLNFEGHFRGINPKRNRWHSSVSFSIMFYWLCFCEGGNHGSFLSI